MFFAGRRLALETVDIRARTAGKKWRLANEAEVIWHAVLVLVLFYDGHHLLDFEGIDVGVQVLDGSHARKIERKGGLHILVVVSWERMYLRYKASP